MPDHPDPRVLHRGSHSGLGRAGSPHHPREERRARPRPERTRRKGIHPMSTLTGRLATAAAAVCGLALVPLAATAAPASASPAAGSAPPVLHSANWAGYITAAPPGRHVGMVTAYWTVPTARPGHSVGKPPYQA